MYFLFFSMQRLNETGDRKFVLSDVGPFGYVPYIRALKFMRVQHLRIESLKAMVEKMNQEMGPDSKFVYTNTYKIVTEIILRYSQYGTLFFFAEKKSVYTTTYEIETKWNASRCFLNPFG
jgi:hypothetical protein